MTRLKPPIGVDSFEEIRTQNYYYVDKTLMIRDLLNGSSKVTLFTRPRRFGKTLNMSMLKSFFEIAENSPTGPVSQAIQNRQPNSKRNLFEGLAIMNEKELCATYMGQYPVVFVSLKGVKGLTFQDACTSLGSALREEAFRLDFLKYSEHISEEEKLPFRRLLREEETRNDLSMSLKMFTRLLARHYGQKVILLIDEYDVPLDKAYQHGYYNEMIDLIRGLFGEALKTNEYLQFAVLTGCLRVSKESISTGLNNLKVNSIIDEQFDEYFGFTDAEVQAMLNYYSLQHHYRETKEWYDGYRFGEQDVYCPWDVIYYCSDLLELKNPKPQAYWLNSSGNDIVRRLIEMAERGWVQSDIEDLIAGKTLRKTLNLQLTHNEIYSNINNVWSMLFMTGYLTLAGSSTADNLAADNSTVGNLPADSSPADELADDSIAGEQVDEFADDSFDLVIPNKEIRKIYQKQVLAWLNKKDWPEQANLAALYQAFATGETTIIRESLNAQLLSTISFYDAYESFYHGFLLALLNAGSIWQAKSNRESGRGRSDIMARHKSGKMGLVIETKYVSHAAKAPRATGQKATNTTEATELPAVPKTADTAKAAELSVEQKMSDNSKLTVEQKLQASCEKALSQIIDNDYAAALRQYKFPEIWAYGIAFSGKQCQVTARRLA